MVVNRKVTGKAASMPGGLAAGLCVSMGLTLAGSMLAGKLVLGERLPESSVGYCAMVILLLAAWLGAWTAASRIKHRRLYVCILSGVLYYLGLMAVTALFFGGIYHGMGATALLVMGGSVAAALVHGPEQGRGRSRRCKNKGRYFVQNTKG